MAPPFCVSSLYTTEASSLISCEIPALHAPYARSHDKDVAQRVGVPCGAYPGLERDE